MTIQQFEKAIKDVNRPLMGLSYRLTKNMVDAQDLYQDTLVKAYSNRLQYNHLDKFRSWIMTIMHNTFVTQYHKKRRRQEILQEAGDAISCLNRKAYQGDHDTRFFLKEVKGMIKKLGDRSGKTIMMYADGFSYEEISGKMQIPVGTVKSRINFARKKLQIQMAALYPQDVRANVC